MLELGADHRRLCERRFEPELAPARAGEVQRIAIDSARARDELGWQPEFSLDQGLESTVDSFRS